MMAMMKAMMTGASSLKKEENAVRLLLNLLWLVLGGLWMAIGWWFWALILAITIIGLPWSKACLRMAELSLWPFGKRVVNEETGGLGLLGNILWFVIAGVWLAIGHLLAALACAVTIIGLPFALQHLKLAALAVAPFGARIEPDDRLLF